PKDSFAVARPIGWSCIEEVDPGIQRKVDCTYRLIIIHIAKGEHRLIFFQGGKAFVILHLAPNLHTAQPQGIDFDSAASKCTFKHVLSVRGEGREGSHNSPLNVSPCGRSIEDSASISSYQFPIHTVQLITTRYPGVA